MNRRELLISISFGTAMAGPSFLRAEESGKPLIAYIDSSSPEATEPFVAAFIEGLGQLGFAADRDVVIEHRWAQGDFKKLPGLVAELVAKKPAVIVAATLPAARAAMAAAPSLPIVFTIGADPVQFGLVPSFNRPGGNVTGVAQRLGELGGKRLELLHQLLPDVKAIAVIANPTNPHGEPHAKSVAAAADKLGLEIEVLPASGESDLEPAFAKIREHRLGGLLVSDDPLFRIMKGQLIALAAESAVPTMHFERQFAAAGGLVSYGPNFVDLYKRVGVLTGKLLKGTAPSDLPVEEPNIFELVINKKTAQALNLAIPPLILARADDVID